MSPLPDDDGVFSALAKFFALLAVVGLLGCGAFLVLFVLSGR